MIFIIIIIDKINDALRRFLDALSNNDDGKLLIEAGQVVNTATAKEVMNITLQTTTSKASTA